jgi:molybdopterin converting factor small subunit
VSLGERLRALMGGSTPKIRVHLVLKGRIGAGWLDVDRHYALAPGSTLTTLVDAAEKEGVRLREAIAASPHLAHTIMLNGERCPLPENAERPLADGDQLYLLGPIAGG